MCVYAWKSMESFCEWMNSYRILALKNIFPFSTLSLWLMCRNMFLWFLWVCFAALLFGRKQTNKHKYLRYINKINIYAARCYLIFLEYEKKNFFSCSPNNLKFINRIHRDDDQSHSRYQIIVYQHGRQFSFIQMQIVSCT